MPESVALGYLGVRGGIGAWKAFGADLFGMEPVIRDDLLELRADDRAWRIAVEQSDEPGVAFVGFEVQSGDALDAIADRLRAAGLDAAEDRDLASRRRVGRLIRTTGPAGIAIELFQGALTLSRPCASPTGARFVTGRAGLGHVLILVPDMAEALVFFEELIGMNRSDVVEMGPGIDAHFLNGGYRHHVVALASLPGLSGLDHIFVEVDDIGTVGLAWDKVVAGAAPIARSIGQHSNDPALSFYVQSPSGFLFEYGAGSKVITDIGGWIQTRWESPYLWGGTTGSHAVR